jgi:hypothetical protein
VGFHVGPIGPHLHSRYNQARATMNLKQAFGAILRFGKSPDLEGDLPVSMVLLLRESRFPTRDQLRSAAGRAFGTSFAGGQESQHCVVQETLFTLMKTGPHTLSFLNYTKVYGDPNFGRSLPKASQQQAWAEHTAWIAVDYVKGGVDVLLEYGVLAKLCAEMLDANCVGLYMPREGVFIPNDGSLGMELQRIAASRHLSVTPDAAKPV